MRARQFKGGGVLNTLINKLPVELHIPGYQYCGPGTKLQKRLARGDPGRNPLDRACKAHDIAYSQSSDLAHRHRADQELASAAWARAKSGDSSIGERIAALGVAGTMKAKVAVGGGVKRSKGGKKTSKGKGKRRIAPPKKVGGFLPLLLAGLGALGSLAGGGAAIARSVNAAKAASKQLTEAERHNKKMEELLVRKGRGLQLHRGRKTGVTPRNKKKL